MIPIPHWNANLYPETAFPKPTAISAGRPAPSSVTRWPSCSNPPAGPFRFGPRFDLIPDLFPGYYRFYCILLPDSRQKARRLPCDSSVSRGELPALRAAPPFLLSFQGLIPLRRALHGSWAKKNGEILKPRNWMNFVRVLTSILCLTRHITNQFIFAIRQRALELVSFFILTMLYQLLREYLR